MPIRALLQGVHSFGPEEIAMLVRTFEDALHELKLTNREDPATLLVAKIIFEAAKNGERDPKRLREATIKTLRQQQQQMQPKNKNWI
jgi:hypothetical protein